LPNLGQAERHFAKLSGTYKLPRELISMYLPFEENIQVEVI
jgi:hypothetical protein